MKTQLTLILALSLIGFNFAHAQPYLVQEVSYKHKPVVEMTINNKKTWVLLDTGSEITILDIKSKKEFGFGTFVKKGYKVPGFGSTGNQLHRATNVDLRFGGVQLRAPMFAFDLSNIAESIEERTGKRITAIIGTGMMQTYGFVIDIGNNRVVMYNKVKGGLKEEIEKKYIVSKTEKNTNKDK